MAFWVALGAQSREGLRALQGTVTRVVDGDTLWVRVDRTTRDRRPYTRNLKVRLHGIDAPEGPQAWGDRARDALRALVLDRPVELRVVTRDDFGRTVALVFIGTRDVSAEMIAAGYGWAFRRYLGSLEGDAHYCVLEYEAREARVGLWSSNRHGAPWVYRHGGEGRSRLAAERSAEDCVASFEAR
jgi:endonuclease YncB( thermonuclease family)